MREKENVLTKVNTLLLVIALLALFFYITPSAYKQNKQEEEQYTTHHQLEEMNSITEMKLNRIREDVHNMQVKHDREIALLRQQIAEQKGFAVSVGNVGTNLK